MTSTTAHIKANSFMIGFILFAFLAQAAIMGYWADTIGEQCSKVISEKARHHEAMADAIGGLDWPGE